MELPVGTSELPTIAELRKLYLDMVQKCVLNQIYEDPNFGFWAPRIFNAALRENGRDWPAQAHSMIGNRRMSNLRELAELVITQGIPGDFIEAGVWRGGSCIILRAVLKAYGVLDRKVWVADSFCGLPQPKPEYPLDKICQHYSFPELAVSLHEVKTNFAKYELLDEQVMFLPGWFSDTLPHAAIEKIAILRLDGDMYESTMDALLSLYDKVVPKGFVIVDDFGLLEGCRRATLDFRSEREINDVINDIDGWGVFWQKS